jgi:hypothetical protein
MALLPPFMLDAVVAIGVGDDVSNRRWIGTGFLFGEALGGTPPQWTPYLVTNKHVLGAHDQIWVKFNSATGLDSTDYPIVLKDAARKLIWTGHPNADTDVAVISIHGGFLQKESRRFSFFQSESHLMTRKEMAEGQITEGDRVFILGFPLGLVDQVRQYTICRHGILSRVRDCLDERSSCFLVDASVFPGNSGGPVIICPSALAIEGTRTIPRAALIGIVKQYLFYEDVAVSKQTGVARVSFQENSGLARVESIDRVLEAIAEDKKGKVVATKPA